MNWILFGWVMLEKVGGRTELPNPRANFTKCAFGKKIWKILKKKLKIKDRRVKRIKEKEN